MSSPGCDDRGVTPIRFEGATKRYGEKTALADLSLEIPAGTLFALVGPNGAGKTTAIGLLTGLLAPTSGRAFVDGIDVAADPMAAKARLGFVPHPPALPPHGAPG